MQKIVNEGRRVDTAPSLHCHSYKNSQKGSFSILWIKSSNFYLSERTWLTVVKKFMTSTQQHFQESLTSRYHRPKKDFISLSEIINSWEMFGLLIFLASVVRLEKCQLCVLCLWDPNSCVAPLVCGGCVPAVNRLERLPFPPEQLCLREMFVWQTVCSLHVCQKTDVQCHVNAMCLSARLKGSRLGKEIQPADTSFKGIWPCFGLLFPRICWELQRLLWKMSNWGIKKKNPLHI